MEYISTIDQRSYSDRITERIVTACSLGSQAPVKCCKLPLRLVVSESTGEFPEVALMSFGED